MFAVNNNMYWLNGYEIQLYFINKIYDAELVCFNLIKYEFIIFSDKSWRDTFVLNPIYLPPSLYNTYF